MVSFKIIWKELDSPGETTDNLTCFSLVQMEINVYVRSKDKTNSKFAKSTICSKTPETFISNFYNLIYVILHHWNRNNLTFIVLNKFLLFSFRLMRS